MADASAAALMRIFVYILISYHVVPSAWCLCEHGTYKHETIQCCYCAPGQNLRENCTVNGTSGKCVPCPSGEYKSEASNFPCKQCISCSQENANQEEETPCKPTENRKCRCKKGYYCPGTTNACTVCQPCEECDHGGKVPCTNHPDTVCKSGTEGASNGGTIAAVVVVVFVVLAGIAGVIWWKKCRGNKEVTEVVQPMRPIPDDIDLHRHVWALAEAIGWKDMHKVAMSSGIPITTIDNCESITDLEERTIELLKIYSERHGRGWGEKLKESLYEHKRTSKAQKVQSILLQDDRDNLP